MTIKRQKNLSNNAKVIWLTGLSGSGKTTIANHLKEKILNSGYAVQVLDGDVLRTGLNRDLGFTIKDRMENIRRVAEVAKLINDMGIFTITSFISPTKEMRNMAKTIIGVDKFIEVFVSTPLEICIKRDVKGLYKKAINGEIPHFTGISSPYEVPENPDIEIKTLESDIEESVNIIFDYLFK